MTEPRTAHDVKLHDGSEKTKAAKHPASADLQRGFIKDCGSVTDPIEDIVDLGNIN